MNTQQETYLTILIPYSALFEHKAKFDILFNTQKGNSNGKGVTYILHQDIFNKVKEILRGHL